MTLVIGVDVGGTKIEAILFDGKRVLKQTRTVTKGKQSYSAALDAIVAAIQEVRTRKVKAIGIGLPGIVRDSKLCFSPHTPALIGRPVAVDISKRTRLPVFVENDAKLFALAEARIGAAKGKSHVAGLTIGTGIGCGLVIEGRVYRGASGGAGEWGHVPYLEKDYESYAGGVAGIERLYAVLTDKKLKSAEVLRKTDAASTAVREEALDALARLLASIINSLNPEVIVLGGSVTKSLSIPDVRNRTRKYSIADNYKHCRIVKYKISDSSGSTGAALLALESLKRK